MSTALERTRAVLRTRAFLQALRQRKDLPDDVRQGAEHLLRHYPLPEEILLLGRHERENPRFLALFTDVDYQGVPLTVDY